MKPLICAAAAAGALLVPLTLTAQIDRISGRAFATRSEVFAQHGMVCTSQPLATQVGLDVLKAGGTAIDAAIAANAALGLMEPVSCGVGGDLFAIIWSAKDKKLYGLNGSGRSPLGLSYEQFKTELTKLNRTSLPTRGILSISVPGAVDAWFEMHAKFGKLPMAQLLAPTIRYAIEGHPVTEYIAYKWENRLATMRAEKFPGAVLEIYTPAGRAPRKGEIFQNPTLANTLRLIGEQGRDGFYRGEIADRIDAFMRASGGYLRKADFVKHTSTWVEPASVNYRGYDVYELPPNSQGIAALQMLNILEGFDLRRMGSNSPDALHLMIEAKKLAFEDRAKYYADPAFARIPLAGLLSKDYATDRRKLISMTRAAKAQDAGHPALNAGDTIYMCTADGEGNMVSLIQSNSLDFGSYIVVPGLGFGFQNRGAMFVLEPSHANVYAPGKRPFQTIIPAFVMKDREPLLAFGVMGGALQPQGHVQILVNLFDFGMNLQEAGDAARWIHLGSTDYDTPKMRDGGYVQVENGIPFESVRELMNRGHDVRVSTDAWGGYQAIMWDKLNRTYIGASESRKDGQAAGW
ncbi:MAG: gamma-glutamyltransferase [Opitutus sp.]|nr:gamma-glutamyltransferase [Opitutus sp.]